MTRRRLTRRVDGMLAILALSLVMVSQLAAQRPAVNPTPAEAKPSKRDTFSATTTNAISATGEKLRIEVFRWSTDEDRDKLVSAFKEKGADQLDTVLQALPESGYVWTAESLGYSVHYAYREQLHNGGERIILATDRPLGSWSGHPWAAKLDSNSITYPYSVIELLLNSSGRGEGKMSLSSKVVASDADKTIALENADHSAAVLKNVQRADANSKN